MARMTLSREFFIPAGAVKIADKGSDAVAYVYTSGQGLPAAMVFFGKQTKPVLRNAFRTEAQREKHVRAYFDARRAAAGRKAASKAETAAWVHTYKAGDIFNTCWGYEQTNREFFQVVETRGKHLILREIAQTRQETSWAAGFCEPVPGKFIGEPIRRLATKYGVKIQDGRTASLWEPGTRVSWSATH